MSADFWAGWISGAAGITIGNPLDILKVQLQNGQRLPLAAPHIESSKLSTRYTPLIRGAAAPILGYGGLNALLFVSYNRTLCFLDPSITDPTNVPNTDLTKIWKAGAIGGLASWIVSAPTELIKCRAQLSSKTQSSWRIARDIWNKGGLRGLYLGGAVTSARDSIGYGFYFWSYELCKRFIFTSKERKGNGMFESPVWRDLAGGGVAGVSTWMSIYPLDVIKTRLQSPTRPLHSNTMSVAVQIYRNEGVIAFFRGLGVCSSRAFVVNAIQWAVYERVMRALRPATV